MKINRAGRWGIAAVTAALAPGCTTTRSQPVTPTPKPTATPPRIAAQVIGFDFTLFGKNGEKVATLKGESATFDPKNLSSALIVNKAKATLYDTDKRDLPAAELTAEIVTADRVRRTLTATGNVTIRSLTEKGTPTIRADRMVWSFDNRTVKGDGNVLITTTTGIAAPGRSFVADIRLHTFHLENDERPAIGAMP